MLLLQEEDKEEADWCNFTCNPEPSFTQNMLQLCTNLNNTVLTHEERHTYALSDLLVPFSNQNVYYMSGTQNLYNNQLKLVLVSVQQLDAIQLALCDFVKNTKLYNLVNKQCYLTDFITNA